MSGEQTFQPESRRLRFGVVTETHPPKINGVALTIAHCVEGLLGFAQGAQQIRVEQDESKPQQQDNQLQTLSLPGSRIPGYPQLKGS